jgi:hypothetical protein
MNSPFQQAIHGVTDGQSGTPKKKTEKDQTKEKNERGEQINLQGKPK